MYQAITAQTREMEAKIEKYESIMRLTSGILRDLAISVQSLRLSDPSKTDSVFGVIHDLADRLYNATIK